MTSKAYERTLASWRKHWSEENETPELRRAINLAKYDFYYGSPQADCYEPAEDEFGNENEWAGYSFEKACLTIKEALDDTLPSTIYIDIDAEDWQTSAPENEECEECHGEGVVNTELNDGTFDDLPCAECNGVGYFEPHSEWYEVPRSELVKAIVGKALAEYV